MKRLQRLTFFLFHSNQNNFCYYNRHQTFYVCRPHYVATKSTEYSYPHITRHLHSQPLSILHASTTTDQETTDNMNKTTASSSPLLHQHLPLMEYLIERKQSQPYCCTGNDDCHIVIGNEAGDADSIISAIAYAYMHDCLFLSSQPQELPSSLSRRLLPIVSISDIDLQTQRPETVLLLKLVGIIPQDHLIYMNTCKDHLVTADNNSTDIPTKNIDVTLVDHNRFNQGNFRKYIQNGEKNMDIDFTVVNIIDHHIDEGYHIETCTNVTTNRNIAFDATANTNVALVASTCTLLVEMLQDHFQNDSIANYEIPYLPLPASLSLLLLGVILLDSINMNVKAGKGTTRDRNAIDYLLHYTDWEGTKNMKNRLPSDTINLLFNKSDDESNTKQYQPNTSLLFETLQNSKFALEFWQTLLVRDALRLDYKMFSTTTISKEIRKFGISTVLMPYQDFTMKHDFRSTDVNHFIKDMDIVFLCIMLASTNQNQQLENSNNLNREIVFIGQNTTILDEMIDYLINTDDVLQLVEMPTTFAANERQDVTLNIRAFQQNNNAASRKQVAPILMKYFTTTTSPI